MTLGNLLSADTILPEMQATERYAAIAELVSLLVRHGQIAETDRDPVLAALRAREETMSTGIGFGIGIPHASTDLIYEVVGAFGRSKGGVNFEALDNQPVNLIMLFLVPQGQFQKHLHTLAKIAKLLHKKEFRQALEVAPDAQAMYQIIRTESVK